MNRYQVCLSSPVAQRKLRFSLNSKSPNTGVNGRVGKNHIKHVTPPSLSPRSKPSAHEDYGRMFWCGLNKVEIEILDSEEEDRLAASIYGGIKSTKSKKKSKKKTMKGIN